MPRRISDLSEHLSNVRVESETGCWVYLGNILRAGGYGRIKLGGVNYRAHRLAYAVANGMNIEDIGDVVIRHSCDNPPCVNPAHLLPGTHTDNMRDKVERGRWATGDFVGSKNPRARLTEANVVEIRLLIAAGKNNTEIAEVYDVHHATISAIRLGKTWNKT